MNLPKDSAELLKFWLHHNNLLAPGIAFSFYKRREEGLFLYFSTEDTFMFCHDIGGLLHIMDCVYDPKKRRLFIDSLKTSLKCILLHNGNKYATVPMIHSVYLKKTYENKNILIIKIKYSDHNWLLCGDLKVFCMLFGQQDGYTKYPCFLYLWDSEALRSF